MQLTENQPKEVSRSKNDMSIKKSCYNYNTLQDYDDCVNDKLSSEIGNSFNCSLPFLKPNEQFEECKLDSMTTEEREDVLRTFEGILFNDFIYSVKTNKILSPYTCHVYVHLLQKSTRL